MLEQIRDAGGDVDEFVSKVKNKRGRRQADGLRPPGVQELRPARQASSRPPPTRSWPRSAATTTCCDIAKQLEEAALTDDYFISRKLYPNVDFYTGLIYRAMGFPTGCSPCCSRSAGCPAGSRTGVRCMHDPDTKIGRPRQIYTGHTERDYVPITSR